MWTRLVGNEVLHNKTLKTQQHMAYNQGACVTSLECGKQAPLAGFKSLVGRDEAFPF